MSREIIRESAVGLVEEMASGNLSSVEITQAHLDRIAEVDGEIHAFLHVDAAGALATAAEVDAARATGADLPELAGVPIAVKDVLTMNGVPTTAV